MEHLQKSFLLSFIIFHSLQSLFHVESKDEIYQQPFTPLYDNEKIFFLAFLGQNYSQLVFPNSKLNYSKSSKIHDIIFIRVKTFRKCHWHFSELLNIVRTLHISCFASRTLLGAFNAVIVILALVRNERIRSQPDAQILHHLFQGSTKGTIHPHSLFQWGISALTISFILSLIIYQSFAIWLRNVESMSALEERDKSRKSLNSLS